MTEEYEVGYARGVVAGFEQAAYADTHGLDVDYPQADGSEESRGYAHGFADGVDRYFDKQP